jgi:SAM-dependent methyltransferase
MMFRRSCPLPGTYRPPWHRRWHRRWRTAVTAPVGRYLSGQAAHPHGPVGRLIAWNWIRETAAVNDTALELLAARPGERICEIGFGPGRTLAHLAAAGTQVIGVDVSPDMVAVAARRNAAAVAAGHIRVVAGDGTALPVDDDTLDGALSVHSVYFWSDPAAVLTAIRRALRPGGRLVLALRPAEHPLPARFDPTIYRLPTSTELAGWLRAAGFTDVRTVRRPRPAAVVWLTAVATATAT